MQSGPLGTRRRLRERRPFLALKFRLVLCVSGRSGVLLPRTVLKLPVWPSRWSWVSYRKPVRWLLIRYRDSAGRLCHSLAAAGKDLWGRTGR
jgi:hypothetical protein